MKKLILIAVGMLTALLGAELLLRLLPVPGGIALASASDAWQTRRLVPGGHTTMSFGWDLSHVTHGTINESGFPASFPYHDGARVGAVIGDSYVEGLSTEEQGRLSSLLAKATQRPGNSVYNFGISGASLPHYLGMARIIGPRYQLDWAALIITAPDFEEGFLSQEGLYHWSETPDLISYKPLDAKDPLTQLVSSSALYRYARMNLKFSVQSLFASGFENEGGSHGCPKSALSAEDNRLLNDWAHALPTALNLAPSKIVLAFDTDRNRYHYFTSNSPACISRDELARNKLAETARALGYQVIDTAPIFAAAWKRDHRPFDHAPLDRHWTDYTNKLVAEAIGDALGLQQ